MDAKLTTWVKLFEAGMRVGDVEITQELLPALVPPVGMAVENWPDGKYSGPVVGRVVKSGVDYDRGHVPTSVDVEIEWDGDTLPSENWVTGMFVMDLRNPSTGASLGPIALRTLFLTNEPLHPHLGKIRECPEPAVPALPARVTPARPKPKHLYEGDDVLRWLQDTGKADLARMFTAWMYDADDGGKPSAPWWWGFDSEPHKFDSESIAVYRFIETEFGRDAMFTGLDNYPESVCRGAATPVNPPSDTPPASQPPSPES